jgi:hypothetical protein
MYKLESPAGWSCAGLLVFSTDLAMFDEGAGVQFGYGLA